ncbi:hypothetical protein ES288_A11G269100v1 [Gossypium darwinii]|uniref:Uncharacterized protein n=1 Tax=Gossypium darwinii TaxID=34276 RepID=A0A5D2EQQ4_GOSDA|nr:hypothetical protein ES288_A11G269100v1 [Gossypium darwinii]
MVLELKHLIHFVDKLWCLAFLRQQVQDPTNVSLNLDKLASILCCCSLFLELLHLGTIRTKHDNGLPQLSQLEPIDLSVALIPNYYNPLVCVLKLLKKLEV